MTRRAHVVATLALAAGWTAGQLLAQGAPPAPQGGGAPAPAAPAGQAPAPAPGRGGGAGAQRGGFTAFTREQASQDQILRGKGLYDNNCASCHAPDLRGTADGKNPNLLRSGLALRDANGELIGAKIAAHTPRINLVQNDVVAVSDYIHSALATRGGRGLPADQLNVLVGDAKAGEAYFATTCASCHSATGDLKGIASKVTDPRALQNAWVSGSTNTFGGGGFGRGSVDLGNPATVTLTDGTKVSGTLVRQDSFLVIVTLADGMRRSFPVQNVKQVEVKDPRAAHRALLLKLAHDDPDNSKMHNVTAYLWTLK